jgi:hypothetical protein
MSSEVSEAEIVQMWTDLRAEVGVAIVGRIRRVVLPRVSAQGLTSASTAVGRRRTDGEVRVELIRDEDLHAEILTAVEAEFLRTAIRIAHDLDHARNLLFRITKWLSGRLAKRRARTLLRTLVARTGYGDVRDPLDGLIDPTLNPEESAERREQIEQVLRAFRGLSPADQRVFMAKFEDGYECLAAVLGITVGALRGRAWHVTERIRRAIEEMNHEDQGRGGKAGTGR